MMKGVNFTFTATNKAAPVMAQFQRGLRAVQNQTQAVRATNGSWMKSMNDNRRTIQQLGFQISDFAVQIGGGQSAMLAFVQQGSQMLQFFGAGGAAAAAFLTVFGTFAMIVLRSGVALTQLTPILGVLENDFRTLAGIIVWTKERFIDAINIIVNHLDVLMIAAASFAIYFGGRWVASIVAGSAAMTALRGVLAATALSFQLAGVGAAAMTLASSTLAGVLNVLRLALVRLGIPALIIGAAYLIERIVALRQATGSWSEVLKLLGDVAKGVWKGIATSAEAIGPALNAVWEKVKAGFLTMLRVIQSAWYEFMVGMSQSALKTGMPELAASLGAVAENAGQALDSTNAAIDEANTAAASYGAEASRIITEGFSDAAVAIEKIRSILKEDPIDIRDWFGGAAGEGGGGGSAALDEIAKKLEDVKRAYSEAMDQFKALGPLGVAGIAELNQAWTKFVQELKTTNDPTGVMERFKNQIGEIAKDAQQLYDAVRSPLENMFMSMVDGTKSVKDAFREMATSVIKELYRILVVQHLVNTILGFFGIKQPVAAPVGGAAPSFAGGGYTGYGARSGGVDGKGGFPAILHPNETVVDHTRGGSGDGVVVNQTISFGSGVTRAEVQSMVPKIVEATKAAVMDARRRGGAYGAATA